MHKNTKKLQKIRTLKTTTIIKRHKLSTLLSLFHITTSNTTNNQNVSCLISIFMLPKPNQSYNLTQTSILQEKCLTI